MNADQKYQNLLSKILREGQDREDRTGVGTRSVFGPQIEFDISEQFPLLTTKKVWFKGVVHELLWIISGSTNIKYLLDNNVHIWDEWADENGDLGTVYGKQWRRWAKPGGGFVDQLGELIEGLKKNPYSRRHIVSAWNPGELEDVALPPCHSFFQFYVQGDKLSCKLYQRSADMFLGVPFNIASYSLLTCMVAQVTGLKPDKFVHTFGDAHIYHNHYDQVKRQLDRDPLKYSAPTLKLNSKISNIDHFKYEDIFLKGYESFSGIKAPVAV